MSAVSDLAIASTFIEPISSLGPQLGSARIPPVSVLCTYLLHEVLIRKAQGVVTLTAYEYEPGANKAVESVFGGKCLQVGYVCFVS